MIQNNIWWVVPLFVTIFSFTRAALGAHAVHEGDFYGALLYCIAAVISLASWLVWALLV